ncbi:MAG: transcriptional repressor LexA [Trichlorobacter sp.]|uniref:transcriptional repressor LexA n=1 Tax=Trichlorobacter sp. TaxID=2911007 RepID=UPI00256AA9A6|nr:transcriptional repressor LexA [Trichlorobacter sp.]
MQELTSRQKEVLDFVCRFRDEHGCPPTLREISEQIGTKGTATAKLHLEALERKGYISRRREGSRGIALKHTGATPVPLPLVGTVRAGQPETAVEEIQGYVSVDPAWLKGEGNFLLRVKGDSMIEAGIFDGDLALIAPQPTAENGQIVVALVDGEATLKRFFMDTTCIKLIPENKHMQPIVIRKGSAETLVVGRLLKTIRSFE